MRFAKQHPIIFCTICLNFLVVVFLVFFMIIKNTKNSVLDISIAPIDAVITIDHKYYKNGTYSINSGKHSIEIAKEGYQTKKYTITTEQNFSFKLYDYLEPNDEDFTEYLSDIENILILEKINKDDNPTIVNFLNSYNKQSDLMKKLPIGYFNESNEEIRAFTIQKNDDENCDKLACLEITDISGKDNKSFIQKYLEDYGFELKFYNINYEGLLK